MKVRNFTVEDAERTIPLVRKIVSDCVLAYRELSDHATEYKRLRARAAEFEDSHIRLNELKRTMADLSDEIDSYVAELVEIGCEMKDLSNGLVDFPSEMDGRPVYLCWQIGEDRVEHWHEVTEGFAGRQPLPVSVR